MNGPNSFQDTVTQTNLGPEGWVLFDPFTDFEAAMLFLTF